MTPPLHSQDLLRWQSKCENRKWPQTSLLHFGETTIVVSLQGNVKHLILCTTQWNFTRGANFTQWIHRQVCLYQWNCIFWIFRAEELLCIYTYMHTYRYIMYIEAYVCMCLHMSTWMSMYVCKKTLDLYNLRPFSLFHTYIQDIHH